MKPFKSSLIALALTAGVIHAAGERPNILYLYVDDMGWGAIGPNGQAARALNGDPHVLTPNIDALAAAGVNFTRAYGCTVCSPARSSQQTGFHQGHTWGDRNDTDNAKKAMRADDRLMGDVLSDAGYVTGYWGKWGYGGSDDQENPDPVILNEQTLPTRHGYEFVVAELHHVRAHTFFQPTLWSAPAPPGSTGGMHLIPNSMSTWQSNSDYPSQPANQNDAGYPSTAYCDDVYAFSALDFVRTQAQNFNANGTPFFGLMAVQVPHTPLGDIATIPGWDSAYAGNTPFTTLGSSAQRWAAMVTRIDAHIGNLLAALEDPNNDGDTSDSVADNTLVIFQSDNGGQGGSPKTELETNGGLRGAKGSIWEGALRVPTVVRWPSKIHAGSSLVAGTASDRVTDVSDWLPTFCDLAGEEVPVGIDGVSLAPTLTGAGHQRTRDFIIHEAQPDYSIIRGKDKLVSDTGTLKLYDLVADEDESENIAGSNPTLVAELEALLLGERVDESSSFANTYHHWTGGDGDATSDADHWSDYIYSNAGLTYQTDIGSPQVSWNAVMENTGATPSTAVADGDLDFLGLAVRGSSATATQSLDLGEHTLNGRNEIRLGAHSMVNLAQGTLESLRWVDLQENASLSGAGNISAKLYHAGTVAVTHSPGATVPGPDIEVPGPDVNLTDGQQLVANGGFELGVGGGDYSYDTLEDWTTDGADTTKDGAKANNPKSGTRRGLINTGYPLVQSTGIPFVSGDTYTLSFWHQGFSGWGTGELAKVRVFYVDSSNQRVDIHLDSFPMTNGTWNQETYNLPVVADANAIGREIHLLVGPDSGTGFASFDDVSLIRHGAAMTVPGPLVTQSGPPIVTPPSRSLAVDGDYHGFTGATLDLTLAGATTPGDDHAELAVAGDAELAGSLALTIDPAWSPQHGDTLTVLTATAINGTFDNPDDRLTASDGTPFTIGYTATNVTVTAVGTTSQNTPYDWLEDEGLVSPGGDYEAADMADIDGDGQSAADEYVAGTDPNDPLSRLALQGDPPAVGSWTLRWASVTGRSYTLEASDDLGSWSHLAGPFAATPPENAYLVDTSGDDRKFIRLNASL